MELTIWDESEATEMGAKCDRCCKLQVRSRRIYFQGREVRCVVWGFVFLEGFDRMVMDAAGWDGTMWWLDVWIMGLGWVEVALGGVR